MDFANHERRIPVSLVSGAVYASIQLDPEKQIMQWLREDLLELTLKNRASGVVLDVSGITMLDGDAFHHLVDTTRMLQLVGATTIVVGLRPGIVAGLCELNVDLCALHGSSNVTQALEMLHGRA